MSGSSVTINIPARISTVMALRTGINTKRIPDGVLQSVNSIKVHTTTDEWKSVNSVNRNVSWRNGPTAWQSQTKPSSSSSSSTQQYQHRGVKNETYTHPQQKYVSKFKKADTSLDNTILNTIINGKLNTFSPTNYTEIKGFLEQILDSGETDFLKDFMILVFKKAAAEEIYCPYYAKLLAELASSYSILNDEMLKLQDTFMKIFDEIEEVALQEDYVSFLERNKQKIYRLGYSQFLAELARHGVLNSTILLATLNKLLEQIDTFGHTPDANKLVEEYCDCLLRMIKIFDKIPSGSTLESLKCDVTLQLTTRMQDILKDSSANYPSVSKKAKFSLMDILDILRA